VEAALRHYVFGEPAAGIPLVTSGVPRYWNEAYVNAEAQAQLDEHGSLDEPRRYQPIIENYGMEK
jgi:hypothetical protein